MKNKKTRSFLKKHLTDAVKGFIAVMLLYVILLAYNVSSFSFQYFEAPQNKYGYNVQGKKYNIGIISSHNNIADIACAEYICKAANSLGWNCYITIYKYPATLYAISRFYLKNLTQIIDFFHQPDFVIHKEPFYYDISNHSIPNYLTLTFDISEIFASKKAPTPYLDPKIWMDIGRYDGYISYNPNLEWVNKINVKSLVIDKKNYDKNFYIAHSHPSLNFIPFKRLKYEGIFYSGLNWDSLRSSKHYNDILIKFGNENPLNIYGPSSSWERVGKLYKGYINNQDDFEKKMQESGITLVLHSQIHLDSGIPTSRIFEAAALSTLIISDEHKFVKEHFGKCVLYVDFKKPVDEVVMQLKNYLQWAKEYPDEAEKMAKCAHEIFAKKFTMEQSLIDIANMHEKVIKHKASNN